MFIFTCLVEQKIWRLKWQIYVSEDSYRKADDVEI